MKKFFIVGLMMLMTSYGLMAQYSLRGTVLNEQNEELVGAVVRLSSKHAVTGIDGSFVIEDIKGGMQRLSVSFLGYETYREEILVEAESQISIVLSPKSMMTSEVTVSALRAKKTDPVAYSELSAEELKQRNFGQDLPYLINMTPGLVVSSDAGAGVGYTSMRLRGSDITRINVTLNGIPLNDSESQNVFWVNMPDLTSSVNQIQVQRGVGTSTNGAASFGGSINISTLNGLSGNQVVVDNAYGSFNTWRNTVQLSTIVPGDKFAFDLRLSNITSDGFIDRGFSDLKSFYLSGGYYGDNTSVRFVTFSGKERSYQAWNGVPKVKLENDSEGMQKLIVMDGWSDEEAANLLSSGARTFNRYLYDNQTDNYQQDHYQLHFSHRPSHSVLLNAAFHYTRGRGYYESFKYDEKFSKYNLPLPAEVIIDGKAHNRTDLIARKWLDNHFYGATVSGVYQYGKLHLVVGGGLNRYEGNHFGDVIWTSLNVGISPNFRWYNNDGVKDELNYFAKTTYSLLGGLSLYADLQGRHVKYDIKGLHDDQRDLTRSSAFGFFNPKFGLNWELSPGKRAFASVAVANREPSRSDFRDADEQLAPQPERLIDYELGLDWSEEKWGLQLNGFYMDYKDQLVLTGKINNVGAYIMNNVPESYRAGLELAGRISILPRLAASANVVLSANKIKNFTEYVDNWDTGEQEMFNLGSSDIAFSPNVTFAGRIETELSDNLTAMLNTRHVGSQYIDNSSSTERRLDSYWVSDLLVRYIINAKSNKKPSIELGAQVNNLFDKDYLSNAWVYSYIYDGQRDVFDGYFPQAGIHFMGQVLIRF